MAVSPEKHDQQEPIRYINVYRYKYTLASQVVLVAENSPANAANIKKRVRYLSWDDPLEDGMTTILQFSCLENPMDRGAWRATVHSLKESDTTEVT